MQIRQGLKIKSISKCLSLLPKTDRKKILLVGLIQVILSLADLIGVALIGLLGALAVNGVGSRPPGNRVSAVLKLLGLDHSTLQTQCMVLGIAASVILVSKTLVSIYFTKRSLLFLSRRSAYISSELISQLLNKPLLTVNSFDSQETIYSVTEGVNAIILGVLGTLVTILSDLSLLVLMVVALIFVDPYVALGSIGFFSLVGFLINKYLHKKAANLGAQYTRSTVSSNQKIAEAMSSYRELVVKKRRQYYKNDIAELRFQMADLRAELNFMPFTSKYILETAVVLGALVMSAGQFALTDASHAVASLAIFLAAGTRVAPAILRIQQSLLLMRSSLGQAEPTFRMIDVIGLDFDHAEVDSPFSINHAGFNGAVEFENVSFKYPSNDKAALRNISLSVKNGTSVAIVGPSGAGKTTLVDVMLSVMTADTGQVLISNLSPKEAIDKYPGALAYVPQNIIITNGTIRENVALGYPKNQYSDDLIWESIELARLTDFVKSLPEGLDTKVGEFGKNISGGQRQRLGIARALFTKPNLLVLDEATSALDGETEFEITEAIKSLAGKVTVVLIAHRLSTVRNSNQVIYMENGEILAQGTFDEVRSQVPNFDRQAKLMGL